ncbi:MAG: phosphate/phosphite/phosphonate ABC transporter substrate-binding protein [Desulfomonilaceae bacterium]
MKTSCMLVFITFLYLLTACNSEPRPAQVDFSRTIPSEQESDAGSAQSSELRVAVGAMVSPKETFEAYRDLLAYLGERIGERATLVQRKTYAEVNQGLASGVIDVAFICTGPYVVARKTDEVRLLAVPQVRGKTTYQAHLIVNANSSFRNLQDLRGKTFAFTDPDSNTGRLVPVAWLSQMGEKPETFFEKTVYTYGHDNSILAVSRNLVDGAAVDGLVWEYLREKSPEAVDKTRVIKKSEPYGIPPVVCSRHLDSQKQERIQKMLLTMHDDHRGREILRQLMIDRFVIPEKGLYDSAATLLDAGR